MYQLILNKIHAIPVWAWLLLSHFAHAVWSEWLVRTEKVAASSTGELLFNLTSRILKLPKKAPTPIPEDFR